MSDCSFACTQSTAGLDEPRHTLCTKLCVSAVLALFNLADARHMMLCPLHNAPPWQCSHCAHMNAGRQQQRTPVTSCMRQRSKQMRDSGCELTHMTDLPKTETGGGGRQMQRMLGSNSTSHFT